ncbi:hypothetical protein LXL04_035792 [Taraxacum kok-saghyz]
MFLKTLCYTSYYRGAMDIQLVYDITGIKNWIHNIEQHAFDNVNKILVGSKSDMDNGHKKKCPFFLSLSLTKLLECKSKYECGGGVFSIARDIKQRHSDSEVYQANNGVACSASKYRWNKW